MSTRPREPSVARLLGSASLQHDKAQAAIAGAFAGSPAEAAERRLDDASRGIFGAASVQLAEAAAALADLLTNRLCISADRADRRALLVDHALERRRAHPVLVAVIGHELARRAGLDSFVAACEGQYWTVLRDGSGFALVGAGSVEELPPGTEIRARCAHQMAYATLLRLRACGCPEWSERAERLMRALPAGGCADGGAAPPDDDA